METIFEYQDKRAAGINAYIARGGKVETLDHSNGEWLEVASANHIGDRLVLTLRSGPARSIGPNDTYSILHTPQGYAA